MKEVYPVIVYEKISSEEYHIVYIPDLDLTTQGKNISECIDMARDLIGINWIDYTEDGLEFPKPFNADKKYPFDDSNLIIKYNTLVDIDFKEYKAELENKSVKKTLTIPYRLNKLGEQQGLNFSRLLQEAISSKLEELDKKDNLVHC